MIKLRLLTVLTALVMALPSALRADGFWTAPGGCFPPLVAEPTSFVGYLGSKNGLGLRLETREPGRGMDFDIRQDQDLGGIWCELLVPWRGCSPLGVAWGIGYLFSDNSPCEEIYTLSNSTTTSQRAWDTAVQWWYWQIAATWDFFPRVSGIAGFRFESFMTTNSRPRNRNGTAGNTGDRGDLIVASYLPYFGLLYRAFPLGGSVNASLGVIGFPTVLGSLDYKEITGSMAGLGVPAFGGSSNNFESGYFLETFITGSTQVGRFHVGAFGRLSAVHGAANILMNENNGAIPTTEFRATLDKQVWIVGGTLSTRF